MPVAEALSTARLWSPSNRSTNGKPWGRRSRAGPFPNELRTKTFLLGRSGCGSVVVSRFFFCRGSNTCRPSKFRPRRRWRRSHSRNLRPREWTRSLGPLLSDKKKAAMTNMMVGWRQISAGIRPPIRRLPSLMRLRLRHDSHRKSQQQLQNRRRTRPLQLTFQLYFFLCLTFETGMPTTWQPLRLLPKNSPIRWSVPAKIQRTKIQQTLNTITAGWTRRVWQMNGIGRTSGTTP